MHTRCSRSILLSFLAALLCAGLAVPAAAQDDGGTEVSKPSPGARVLKRMHVINRFQVRVGKMAMRNGSNDRVRRLGERLMRDHRNAGGKVTGMADEMNISLPAVDLEAMLEAPDDELTDRQRMMIDALKEMRGAEDADFDEAYVDAMIETHEEAIGMLDDNVDAIEAEPVQNLARKVIPILEQHLELATIVQGDLETEAEPEPES